MFQCTKCKEFKNIGLFPGDKKKKDGIRLECKKCRADYAREAHQANKERNNQACLKWSKNNKDKLRDYYLKTEYGINQVEWQNLFDLQKGCCAICNIHQSQMKAALHIDHDHTSGEVRGLLCGKCNRGLGFFEDNEDNLRKAVSYLNKPRLKLVGEIK